ncbi:MAG TPA: hypothetical protein VF746_18845 [Longimicrobium sp.]|jgi:hypothetical protein
MAAACPTMRFEGITRREWDCLREEARRRGIPIPKENDGTASAHGAEAEYRWDADSGVLTVTFTRKPDWIGCDEIERRLRDAVRICGGR